MANPFSGQARVKKMGVRGRRLRGVFISFEGIEGCGKTTQRDRLAKLLRERGHKVVETREPGGTPLAERIRQLLLEPSGPSTEPITPQCEAYLVQAGRAQHIEQVIRPALKEGAVVLCDRFSDSTLAYQGYARGMDRPFLEMLNRAATKGLSPDLTVLFDLPVPLALARRRKPEIEQNRLDRETRRFHERVRQGFLTLAARHPRRIKLIDARPDPDRVLAQVAAIVSRFLKRRKRPVTRDA